MNWDKLKAEYVNNYDMSYRKLAEKYGLDVKALQKRGQTERWAYLKKEKHGKIGDGNGLRLMGERSRDEVGNLAKKGGINSGRSRKLRKPFKECTRGKYDDGQLDCAFKKAGNIRKRRRKRGMCFTKTNITGGRNDGDKAMA